MSDVAAFREILDLCDQVRANCRRTTADKTPELEIPFGLLVDLIGSLRYLYALDELKASQREAALEVLMQALETTLGMYFLSEDGFWPGALALKRNYTELLAVAVAIGTALSASLTGRMTEST